MTNTEQSKKGALKDPFLLHEIRHQGGRLLDFVILIAQRFYNDRCFGTAGDLTFTTLLALVPLATVLFGVLSMFPAFRDMTADLRQLLVTQFVPTSGALVQHYLTQFSEKASRLTVMGSIWLFVTAVLTLWTIDNALNAIWRSSMHRDTLVVFIVYWALLTLGPLLFGTGFAVTTYVYTKYQTLFGTLEGGLASWIGWILLSVSLETIGFTLLFVLVPRTRVRIWHASVGGLLVAVLFEIAKRGFAFYVAHFKNYEMIYGAFSAVPIFLIWIYLAWLIVLLGAEVTACLTLHCHRTRMADEKALQSLRLAVRLIVRLAEAQWQGEGVPLHGLVKQEPEFTPTQIESMLQHLARIQFVRYSGGKWYLIRELRGSSLFELYHQGGFSLQPTGPHGAAETMAELDERLDNLLALSEHDLKARLGGAISDLLPENMEDPDYDGKNPE